MGSRIKSHLKPLAIAATVSQAVHICMDQILLIFALLLLRYSELTADDDAPVRTAMLSAIEARWKKVDQDAFIAALILNPVHKTRALKKLPELTLGGIYALFRWLWMRFYNDDEPPFELWLDVEEYMEGRGAFASMNDMLIPVRIEAEQMVSTYRLLASPSHVCSFLIILSLGG